MTASKDRQYFIDWIRVFAFLVLILFHSSMPFVPYGWEVKNANTSQGLMNIIWWFHQWRLPLLFFISGVGIYYSLQRRTVLRFLWERFNRLLIPLLFAMFFLIPVQVWVEYTQKGRIHETYPAFYPTVWELVPYPEGTLTWSHMWFVVYLIVFILLLTPLFGLVKIKFVAALKDRFAHLLSHPVGMVLLTLPLMGIYALLYLDWPVQGSLLDDWFLFCFSLCFLVYGYLLAGSERFWSHCEKYRKYFLSAAILAITLLYAEYWWPVHIPEQKGNLFTGYLVLNCLEIWMVILSICGFAKKHLNFSSPALTYLNTAVYPYYIIHQTIIVVIGYLIVQMPLPILPKWILLTVLSSMAIFATYHFIIRRTRVTRYLFGVKETRN